jgi:hypothetical protein
MSLSDRGATIHVMSDLSGIGNPQGPVPALHAHSSPVTGATVVASWPCAQCRALGRNAPLTYISDGGTVPDGGGVTPTGVPHDRLDAYLATFPPPATPSPVPGGHRARRTARRKAAREARRRNS